MKNIYLLKYSVKGIKTLDELVSLSFYKKIIPKNPDTQEYNIKAIYGMNGTGKSAIVCSVEILKNLLVNEEYLTNPLVQKKLGELINKKTNELFIEADYLYKYDNGQLLQFYYNVIVSRTVSGKYVVSYEKLTSKNATSKSEKMTTIFEIQNGKIVYIERKEEDKEFTELLFNKTMNLLENSSMACLFMNKLFRNIVIEDKTIYKKELFFKLVSVGVFGLNLHAYMDQYDYHKEYLIENPEKYCEYDIQTKQLQYLIMSIDGLCDLKGSKNYVLKKAYKQFSKAVGELYEFLHIFKSDLKNIEIDRKENKDFWLCDLIMVYDDYKVHAEFESTGIKKLIRLFTYLQKMVRGEIVFIDEFDSNLHDVYLCAILEYLMCLNTQERNIVDQKLWNLSKNLNKLVIKSAEHLSWLFNLQRIERWAEEFRNSGRSGFGKEPDSYYLYLLLYVIYLLKEEVSVGEIPPLAVTLPYNSERIRAQKGVFTVFPQYQNDTKLQNAAKMGVHLDAMQNMTPINHCLHRIKLFNVDRIAYEMMNQGMNISWIYPEMPVVANEIESRRITV